jgi:hypothetical protein
MEREYWKTSLLEAQAELEAATQRSDVGAAARKVMRAKAALMAGHEDALALFS